MDAAVDANGALPVADVHPVPDVAPPVDAATSVPDVPSLPDAPPPVPDVGPDGPPPPSPVEVCNGLDDDNDGQIDEDGDAACAAVSQQTRYCRDGQCVQCVLGQDDTCGVGEVCVQNGNQPQCATCDPTLNGCPAARPYCDPHALFCTTCPELLPFDGEHVAELCSTSLAEAVCQYVFHTGNASTATCAERCRSIGLYGCRAGHMATPAEPGPDGREHLCTAGQDIGCGSAVLGETLCDCAQ